MKNILKNIVWVVFCCFSSSFLCGMEQIPLAEQRAFIEEEGTQKRLLFIGKARAAEKAWKKAFQLSKASNVLWKNAYIADKRGLDTFEALDEKVFGADQEKQAAEIKAACLTAQVKALHKELKIEGIHDIKLSWANVKMAESLYLLSLTDRGVFARLYQDYNAE